MLEVSGGEVTMQGSVQVRQQKYAAEDIVADVFGVSEIHNQLAVAGDPSGSDEPGERLSGP